MHNVKALQIEEWKMHNNRDYTCHCILQWILRRCCTDSDRGLQTKCVNNIYKERYYDCVRFLINITYVCLGNSSRTLLENQQRFYRDSISKPEKISSYRAIKILQWLMLTMLVRNSHSICPERYMHSKIITPRSFECSDSIHNSMGTFMKIKTRFPSCIFQGIIIN